MVGRNWMFDGEERLRSVWPLGWTSRGGEASHVSLFCDMAMIHDQASLMCIVYQN